MGLLSVGQLVTSRAGRDSGRKYVVIGFDESGYVLVADGMIRKINRPKRKNIKHLIAHGQCWQVFQRRFGCLSKPVPSGEEGEEGSAVYG